MEGKKSKAKRHKLAIVALSLTADVASEPRFNSQGERNWGQLQQWGAEGALPSSTAKLKC